MPPAIPFQFKKMRTVMRRVLILALFIVGDPTPESLIAGTIFIFFGQLLHLIAGGTLIKTEVITIAGPYRYVRNPFYVASFLSDVGFCIIAWNPIIPAIWFPLFYGFVIHPRTLNEEKELLQIHGKPYQDYLDKVPRYIPSPWPRYPHVRGSFSWEPLHRNRELPRQLRHFAFALMFFAKSRMIDLQGDALFSVKGFPRLLHDSLGAFAFYTGLAMIVAPWIVKPFLRKRRKPAPSEAVSSTEKVSS